MGTKSSSSIDIYDSQGKAVPATMTYTKTGPDAWSLSVTVPDATGKAVQVGSANLTWDEANKTFAPTTAATLSAAAAERRRARVRRQRAGRAGHATRPLTQFAAADTAGTVDQDGAEMGTLESFTIDPGGQLIGVFSNGHARDPRPGRGGVVHQPARPGEGLRLPLRRQRQLRCGGDRHGRQRRPRHAQRAAPWR